MAKIHRRTRKHNKRGGEGTTRKQQLERMRSARRKALLVKEHDVNEALASLDRRLSAEEKNIFVPKEHFGFNTSSGHKRFKRASSTVYGFPDSPKKRASNTVYGFPDSSKKQTPFINRITNLFRRVPKTRNTKKNSNPLGSVKRTNPIYVSSSNIGQK